MPESRTPPETGLSRRERKKRRREQRKARWRVYQRRFLLLLPLGALMAGLVAFMVSTDEELVSRVQTPTAEPRPAGRDPAEGGGPRRGFRRGAAERETRDLRG